MSTTIKPELSERNKYWIEKHRYYELKHFCLQYPYWKKAYILCSVSSGSKSNLAIQNNDISKPTEECALKRVFYSTRMSMVEQAAKDADVFLSSYILKAVTTGMSYDTLRVQTNIPCSRDVYYECYRKFFWLLDKARA